MADGTLMFWIGLLMFIVGAVSVILSRHTLKLADQRLRDAARMHDATDALLKELDGVSHG